MLEDLDEAEVVLADIPALDPSSVLIPVAETLTFSAYVSTALSTLTFGPSFAVASSLAAAVPAVAFCAPSWVARSLARFHGVFAVLDHFGNLMLSAFGYADQVLHVLCGQR